MLKLRTLLMLLTMGLSANSFAQVYQSTDAEGNPSFSDTPSAGSEEIELPETNVGDSVKVPEPSAEPEPKPVPKPEVVEQPAPPTEAVEGDNDNGGGNYRRRHHRRYGHGR